MVSSCPQLGLFNLCLHMKNIREESYFVKSNKRQYFAFSNSPFNLKVETR